MAAVSISFPKHWEDWCKWLLGFWLCISPWILQFDLEPRSTLTAVITGILIVFFERVTLFFLSSVGGMDQQHTWSVARNMLLDFEY